MNTLTAHYGRSSFERSRTKSISGRRNRPYQTTRALTRGATCRGYWPAEGRGNAGCGVCRSPELALFLTHSLHLKGGLLARLFVLGAATLPVLFLPLSNAIVLSIARDWVSALTAGRNVEDFDGKHVASGR